MEFPSVAAKARRSQRTFLGKKMLAADIGKALAGYRAGGASRYSPWCLCPKHILELLGTVLARTTTEKEASELIRIYQGSRKFPVHAIIRGLGHAVVLAKASQYANAEERADAIVAVEDAVQRAYAQSGGHVKTLASSVLTGLKPAELLEATPPTLGLEVHRTRPVYAKDIGYAIEGLADGDHLVEWLYIGERIQVHVTAGGTTFEVFSKRIRWTTDKSGMASEVKTLLGDCLKVDTCILDAILITGKKRTTAECKEEKEAHEKKKARSRGRPRKDE